MTKRFLLVNALLFSLIQLGCSNSDESGQQHAEKAQEQAKQGNLSAAAIEYKNALQKNPQDAQARFALAELYLKQELGRAAEKEFLQARQLGMDEDRIGPPLGEALLLSRDFKRVLELVNPALAKTLEKRADMLRINADAQFGLGQVDLACTQYQEALNLDPKLASAYWGLARCARVREGVGAARAMYNKALELNPKNARTRAEFGNMEYGLGNLAAAEKQYAEAMKLDSDLLQAQAGFALVTYLQGRVEPASAEIGRLRKKYPDSPLGKSLQAMIDFDKRDFVTAFKTSSEALNDIPNHLPTLALNGRAAYKLGRYDEAWRSLSKYLLASPENAHVRKLVANAQIKLKRNMDALETLAPLISEQSRDADALILAGGANVLLNKAKVAAKFYERALVVDPQSAAAHIAMAQIQTATQENRGAKEHLQKALQIDPNNLQASYGLARLHLELREYEQALGVLADIEKKWPNRIETPVLKAQALYDMKDVAAARRTLEARLAAVPKDVGAALNLARIDVAENKLANAKRQVKSVLSQKSDHLEALLMQARIAGQEGNAKEHLKWLQQAVQTHPADIVPALELARYYLVERQPYKALEWARQAEKIKADAPEVLIVLAATQIAAGEKENALASYHRLATSVLPNSPTIQLRHAQLQLEVNSNREGARFSLGQALQLQPDYLEAQSALISLDTADRKYNAALETARKVQAQRPAEAIGHVFEGDVMMAQNRYTAAVDAYRKGIDKNGGGTAAANLHRSLVLAGRKGEAEKALDEWLAKHPSDIPVRLYRSESAIAEGQFEPARMELETIQRIQPDLPNVLNNLATIYATTRDPRALDFAQRANKLAPDNPLIADTLGWILVERGQTGQGLVLLRKAQTMQPGHPQINYHLAAALARSGAKNDARGILKNLLSGPQAFPERPQAEALWKQLNG
jgi:putative PEP-CTERM system TPR-repeat lipoprotein